jgi:hypothetical protein
MTVSFNNISNAAGPCAICHEPLENTRVVAHSHPGKNGPIHEIHQGCLKQWAKINATCPSCRASFDPSSIFSWKERVIAKMNTPKARAAADMVVGITLGAVVFVSIMGKDFETAPLGTQALGALVSGAIAGAISIVGHLAVQRYRGEESED